MNELTETLIKIDSNKKYGLYRLRHNQAPTLIKGISPAEAKEFVVNTHYVNDFLVLKERVVKAEMNLNDLNKSAERDFEFDEEQSQFAEQLKTTKLDLVNVNRLCSNYVYSWHNCIELMEVQVRRVYGHKNSSGEKTPVFLRWEAIKQGYFNNRFEYRFVYTARNYQHAENLIAGIYYGSDGKQKPVPMLSKAYLTNFNDFNKQAFANDWQKYPPRIAALPILSESISVLKEVSEEHLQLNKDFFLRHASSIYEKYGRYNNWNVAIAVKPSYGLVSSQEFQEVQIDVAKYVIDYYNSSI